MKLSNIIAEAEAKSKPSYLRMNTDYLKELVKTKEGDEKKEIERVIKKREADKEQPSIRWSGKEKREIEKDKARQRAIDNKREPRADR